MIVGYREEVLSLLKLHPTNLPTLIGPTTLDLNLINETIGKKKIKDMERCAKCYQMGKCEDKKKNNIPNITTQQQLGVSHENKIILVQIEAEQI